MSHCLWQQRFGAQDNILGRKVVLDGASFRVVGVMPPRFGAPTAETELWLPRKLDPERVSLGGFSPVGIGLLKPGISVAEAQADLESLVPRFEERFPGRPFSVIVGQAGMTPRLTLLKEEVVGDVESMRFILLGTVGLVLLLACANVANLFIVRAEARRREVAIHTALGAGRSRVVRQFLTESLLLAGVGGAFGVALAYMAVDGLVALGPRNIPRLRETVGGHVPDYPHDAVPRRRVFDARVDAFTERTLARPPRLRQGLAHDNDARPVLVIAPLDGTSGKREEIVYEPMIGRDESVHVPRSMSFAVKVSSHPEDWVPAVRSEVAALDPNLPIAEVRTLEALVADARAPTAFAMVLLGIAAVVALVLGAIGVYGVQSYMVSQRTGEIGVRMALGATAGHVSQMILRRGVTVAVAGVVIGWVGALGMTRWIESSLIGVPHRDIGTYAAVSLALVSVAIVASYLPARRASRQDPTVALRSE